MNKTTQVKEVIKRLKAKFPNPKIALNFATPFELMTAVILSAQCTDKRINMITPALFARYPEVADYATADREELEQLVKQSGFYHSKARYIQESAQMILAQFGGKVPTNMKDLLTLPGVARKTANVVISTLTDNHEGVVVDTHVKRITKLLGLTKSADPKKIEQEMVAIVPKIEWRNFSHLLILHGRETCIARRPRCHECILLDICPRVGL